MDSETEECKECPPGTFNEKMGRKADCSECEAGKYSADGSATCSKCEAGTVINTQKSGCSE